MEEVSYIFAKILDAFEAEHTNIIKQKLGVSKRQILRVLHQLEAAHYIEEIILSLHRRTVKTKFSGGVSKRRLL